MKKSVIFLTVIIFILSCTSAKKDLEKLQESEKETAANSKIILSLDQIKIGLTEGMFSVPYYISTDLHDINRGFIYTNSKITLYDTYEYAYEEKLYQLPPSGNTGKAFKSIRHANELLHKLLSHYGIENAQNYILTNITSAVSKGYMLFAVVYRPYKSIKVFDKYKVNKLIELGINDALFYETYQLDVYSKKIDTVVDWVGLPIGYINNQKAQAIILTIAANAVVLKKRKPDYWNIEQRWVTGEYSVIVANGMAAVSKKMEIY